MQTVFALLMADEIGEIIKCGLGGENPQTKNTEAVADRVNRKAIYTFDLLLTLCALPFLWFSARQFTKDKASRGAHSIRIGESALCVA